MKYSLYFVTEMDTFRVVIGEFFTIYINNRTSTRVIVLKDNYKDIVEFLTYFDVTSHPTIVGHHLKYKDNQVIFRIEHRTKTGIYFIPSERSDSNTIMCPVFVNGYSNRKIYHVELMSFDEQEYRDMLSNLRHSYKFYKYLTVLPSDEFTAYSSNDLGMTNLFHVRIGPLGFRYRNNWEDSERGRETFSLTNLGDSIIYDPRNDTIIISGFFMSRENVNDLYGRIQKPVLHIDYFSQTRYRAFVPFDTPLPITFDLGTSKVSVTDLTHCDIGPNFRYFDATPPPGPLSLKDLAYYKCKKS